MSAAGEMREVGPSPSLVEMAGYFLRLGALGFGGPVALAHAMRRDLVEARGWLSEREYDDGLAIAAACPGPLAYQLGVYCGYLRHGVLGGLAVAGSFALAPFVLVVAAAWAYMRWSGSWQIQALFYGVAPVVVALIVKACVALGRKTLRREPIAWTFFLAAGAITVIVQRELTAIFLAAGALGVVLLAPPPELEEKGPPAPPPVDHGALLPAALALPAALPALATRIFLFFFKTGLLVFGSGLVIVPFLKTALVDQHHWLNDRQFLDAVAIGMISPGPVVITATFVGFVLDGLLGATAATVGIFAPAVLLTVLATPLLLRHRRNRRLRGFIRGVTVAVVGVLVGTTWLVARNALVDPWTAAIGTAALVVLMLWKKVPEPLLVGIGAALGLVAHALGRFG